VERASLDELRRAAFGKRHVDDVEVLGNDRLGEDLPRFAGDLRT